MKFFLSSVLKSWIYLPFFFVFSFVSLQSSVFVFLAELLLLLLFEHDLHFSCEFVIIILFSVAVLVSADEFVLFVTSERQKSATISSPFSFSIDLKSFYFFSVICQKKIINSACISLPFRRPV